MDAPTAQPIADRHLGWLRALHATAVRIVTSTPEHYLVLGLIAALFPGAQIIHCRRDPRDTAPSCWMTCFTAVRWAFDMDRIADRFRQYRRLTEHWERVLPMRIHHADYEVLVTDLEPAAGALVEHLGLAWDPACLAHERNAQPIRTASDFQARRPAYRSSVDRRRCYEVAIRPLFGQLDR